MNKRRILSLLLAAVLSLALAVPTLAVQNSKYNDDWVFIAVDPGHGGIDSGCVATYGGKQYTERDICMQLGLYLKEELESYRHVKVFLTRTPDTPSYKLPSGELKSRMQYAALECCDFLISLHINDVAPNVRTREGVCALVSNGNYRPEIGEAGKAVAAVALAELEKLGVKNEGFLYRNSEDHTLYPNGRLADYYGIVRHGILMNIPSTLIEHGYIRNEYDFRTLLSSEAKLRAVARADAAGLVQYFGLEKKTDGDSEKAPLRLNDIAGHWAAKNITTAVGRGWVTGYPDHSFKPNATLTRADFVTLLSRMSGEDLSAYETSSFPDVAKSAYYQKSVSWAVDAKIVNGFPDGTFKPTQNVTREQMAHIMRLYLIHKGLDVSAIDPEIDGKISDLSSIGEWAQDDVRFCYGAGLLQGRGSAFDPAGNATRAEAATVLLRLYDYVEANSLPDTPDDPEQPDDPENPTDPEEPAVAESLRTPIYSGVMPEESAD